MTEPTGNPAAGVPLAEVASAGARGAGTAAAPPLNRQGDDDVRPGSASSERRRHLVAGARAMGPWLLGVVPFGLVIGVSAAQADMPGLAGWSTGPLIFGGSAQLTTIQLLDGGAVPIVVVVAALTVNLRLVLYSATMARHWQGAPRWWQAVAAALLVDPSLSVGLDGYERAATPRHGHLHYMGGALALLVAWVTAMTVGVTFGAALPAGLRLELVIPLFLIGEVVARLDRRATMWAVGVAATVGVVGTWAPIHLGPVLAIGGGLTAALLAEGSDR